MAIWPGAGLSSRPPPPSRLAPNTSGEDSAPVCARKPRQNRCPAKTARKSPGPPVRPSCGTRGHLRGRVSRVLRPGDGNRPPNVPKPTVRPSDVFFRLAISTSFSCSRGGSGICPKYPPCLTLPKMSPSFLGMKIGRRIRTSLERDKMKRQQRRVVSAGECTRFGRFLCPGIILLSAFFKTGEIFTDVCTLRSRNGRTLKNPIRYPGNLYNAKTEFVVCNGLSGGRPGKVEERKERFFYARHKSSEVVPPSRCVYLRVPGITFFISDRNSILSSILPSRVALAMDFRYAKPAA